jgi:hypothetical protein
MQHLGKQKSKSISSNPQSRMFNCLLMQRTGSICCLLLFLPPMYFCFGIFWRL